MAADMTCVLSCLRIHGWFIVSLFLALSSVFICGSLCRQQKITPWLRSREKFSTIVWRSSSVFCATLCHRSRRRSSATKSGQYSVKYLNGVRNSFFYVSENRGCFNGFCICQANHTKFIMRMAFVVGYKC